MCEEVNRRGQAGGSSDGSRGHRQPKYRMGQQGGQAVCMTMHKRGRQVVIGKLVQAQPLGEMVLAMPYRHRRTVQHVSLPPSALSLARSQGIRWWIVRHDLGGECYGLFLDEVERRGWLQRTEGRPEWFVPLSAFRPIAWQDWPYVHHTVQLDDESRQVSGAEQGRLL